MDTSFMVAVARNPQGACYVGGAVCGFEAAKEGRNTSKYFFMPNEANISNQQDLSAHKDKVVLLRGFLGGEEVLSDGLTLANEARRCFQELTITHTFNVECAQTVQHLTPSHIRGADRNTLRAALYDRTHTTETHNRRPSDSVTEPIKASGMFLRIFPPNESEIRISIARPDQETNIVGHEHSSTLLHPNSIRQASLRCNHTGRRNGSTYSISEKYLEIGNEVSVLGKLLIHSQRGQADKFEIVEPKLISIKTKYELKKESAQKSCYSALVSACCIGTGYFCCKKRHKND